MIIFQYTYYLKRLVDICTNILGMNISIDEKLTARFTRQLLDEINWRNIQ